MEEETLSHSTQLSAPSLIPRELPLYHRGSLSLSLSTFVTPHYLLAQVTCGSTNNTQKLKSKLCSSKVVVLYMPKITHANFRCGTRCYKLPHLYANFRCGIGCYKLPHL
ncbi:hypothetical protein CsSME_00006363 [Camellia sinensis var. sinensis]